MITIRIENYPEAIGTPVVYWRIFANYSYLGATYDSMYVNITNAIHINLETVKGSINPIFYIEVSLWDAAKRQLAKKVLAVNISEDLRIYNYNWGTNTLSLVEPPKPPPKKMGVSWQVPVVVGGMITLFAIGVYSSRKTS